MVEKEKWDPDIMCYSNSEEFQYLTQISNLIDKSKHTIQLLEAIYSTEHWNIQLGNRKDKSELSDIKKQLETLITALENLT